MYILIWWTHKNRHLCAVDDKTASCCVKATDRKLNLLETFQVVFFTEETTITALGEALVAFPEYNKLCLINVGFLFVKKKGVALSLISSKMVTQLSESLS